MSFSKTRPLPAALDPAEVFRKDWAPLLITVGPPCAGKSTFTSKFEGIHLFEHDSHAQTYERLSLAEAIRGYLRKPGSSSSSSSSPASSPASSPSLTERKVFKRSLQQRLAEPNNIEQVLVAMLFVGKVSLVKLRSRLDPSIPRDVAEKLVKALEAELAAGHSFAVDSLDIYIPEALPAVVIPATHEALIKEIQNNPELLAYCSTGVDPQRWKPLLECCRTCYRSVRFVRWHNELPYLTLDELLARNVRRFLMTGRYIPCQVLAKLKSQADALIRQVEPATHNDFAKLAGMKLNKFGFVSLKDEPLSSCRPRSVWRKWTNKGLVAPLDMTCSTFSSRDTNDEENDWDLESWCRSEGLRASRDSSFYSRSRNSSFDSLDSLPGLEDELDRIQESPAPSPAPPTLSSPARPPVARRPSLPKDRKATTSSNAASIAAGNASPERAIPRPPERSPSKEEQMRSHHSDMGMVRHSQSSPQPSSGDIINDFNDLYDVKDEATPAAAAAAASSSSSSGANIQGAGALEPAKFAGGESLGDGGATAASVSSMGSMGSAGSAGAEPVRGICLHSQPPNLTPILVERISTLSSEDLREAENALNEDGGGDEDKDKRGRRRKEQTVKPAVTDRKLSEGDLDATGTVSGFEDVFSLLESPKFNTKPFVLPSPRPLPPQEKQPPPPPPLSPAAINRPTLSPLPVPIPVPERKETRKEEKEKEEEDQETVSRCLSDFEEDESYFDDPDSATASLIDKPLRPRLPPHLAAAAAAGGGGAGAGGSGIGGVGATANSSASPQARRGIFSCICDLIFG